jgi:hypothetical protein
MLYAARVRRRVRLTIPRRVFLAFALMLAVSASVSVASFLEHRQTAATLSLVHGGYLPLAVSVSEARATQSVFGNVLDRMLTERSTLPARAWLAAARKLRPAGIARALDGIAAIEHMAPPAPDRATLARARRELKRVASMVDEGEPRYGDLFAALDEVGTVPLRLEVQTSDGLDDRWSGAVDTDDLATAVGDPDQANLQV